MKLACGSGFRNTDLAGHEYLDFLTSANSELKLQKYMIFLWHYICCYSEGLYIWYYHKLIYGECL